MWKIYAIVFLWTQLLSAQQVTYTNSRGGAGPSTFATSNADDSLTGLQSPQVPSRAYNTNSRNSFGNTQNLLTSPQTPEIERNANFYQANDVTKKFPVVETNSFNAKLFEILSSKAKQENLVYSPISLQTVLAFIFTMSENKLYEELAQLLAISGDRSAVAKTFEIFLATISQASPPTTLLMANKLYYDYRFGPLDPSVRSFAKKSFASEMEQIDFVASRKAANMINSWVSERTRGLIKDIVEPTSISGDTSALMVNSLYFKSDWLTKFASYDTETQNFFLTRDSQVPVDMMYNEDVFRYGDFQADLGASVVELPYKTMNLSMLVILPKDIEGLEDLERKLKYYDLESLARKLKREVVSVKLPRFKIEYELDLIKPLQDMGLNALFNNAGSINLFKNQQKPLRVDQFKQKCFINVNEAGTEAAAATVAKYIPLSIPTDLKIFTADHPFVFVIRNSNTTFFIGHVVRF